MAERWLDRQVTIHVNGAPVDGVVVTERRPGGVPVLGVRLADGRIETWVPDDRRPEAIEPRALARAVLDGRDVRMPVQRILRTLAAAVINTATEGGD